MLFLLEKILKRTLMLIIFCLLPMWVFLPFAIAGLFSVWMNDKTAIVLGIIFGLWFYGAGIVMFPWDIGFFKNSFWDMRK